MPVVPAQEARQARSTPMAYRSQFQDMARFSLSAHSWAAKAAFLDLAAEEMELQAEAAEVLVLAHIRYKFTRGALVVPQVTSIPASSKLKAEMVETAALLQQGIAGRAWARMAPEADLFASSAKNCSALLT